MNRPASILILACGAAAFALGLVWLLELRIESGDVYPPYSTFRSDPVGAMAIYESLGRVPGLTVRRDLSDSNRLPEEPETVYVQLASQPFEWEWLPPEVYADLKDFLARGGRLVLAASPQRDYAYDEDAETNRLNQGSVTNLAKAKPPIAVKKPNPDHPEKKKPKRQKGEDDGFVSLSKEWGFHAGWQNPGMDETRAEPVQARRRADLPLPENLAWYGGVIFTNCDAPWRTIYALGNRPVMIERDFGRGSAVLAGDSYFASNEAMMKDRHSDLWMWLVGGRRNVCFDENHFGIMNTPGIATLMRQYRLEGLGAGLLLLAALYIWKSATSLLPKLAEEADDGVVAGRDAGAGFVNLLRRSVPPREILAVAYAEWKKSAAAAGKYSPGRRRQAEAIFQAENAAPASARDPAAAYDKIAEALGHGKTKS